MELQSKIETEYPGCSSWWNKENENMGNEHRRSMRMVCLVLAFTLAPVRSLDMISDTDALDLCRLANPTHSYSSFYRHIFMISVGSRNNRNNNLSLRQD
jgi:hypothetical protein